jgi:amino acid permease
MQIAHFALLFSVIASIPIAMIPSKDSIEELFFKDKGMSKSLNLVITFLLISLNCIMALFVPDIGSAITLVGSTINPIIGFILPVILYWPYIKRKSIFAFEKITAISTVLFMIIVSILSLIDFFSTKYDNIRDPDTC